MKCEKTKIITTAWRSGTAAAHRTPRLVRLYLAWKSFRARTQITPRWSQRLLIHCRREVDSGPSSSTGGGGPRSTGATGVDDPLIAGSIDQALGVPRRFRSARPGGASRCWEAG